MTLGLSACTRCGKVRNVTKTYKEYIGTFLVVSKLTSCPDASCQAVVDIQLAKEQAFRDEMQLASDKRHAEAKERRTHKYL